MKIYAIIFLWLTCFINSCGTDNRPRNSPVVVAHFSIKLSSGVDYGFGDNVNNSILTLNTITDSGFTFEMNAKGGANVDQGGRTKRIWR